MKRSSIFDQGLQGLWASQPFLAQGTIMGGGTKDSPSHLMWEDPRLMWVKSKAAVAQSFFPDWLDV